MSDDRLLETLGKAAREQARDDPLDEQWDALSRGELDEAQIEALTAAAADNTVAQDAVEAFRPLGDDFRTTVASKVAGSLAAPGAATGDTTMRSGGDAAPIPFPGPGERATPKRRSRMNFAPAALAASVMLAVGIGFFAMPRTGVEPIPGYTALIQGGASSRSGNDTASIPVFRAGDRFELRLTPETAVEGDVVARIYIDMPDGLEMLDTPPAVVAPSGAVRIVGTAGGDVVLPAGESQLYVVLGRENALPDEQEIAGALATDDSTTRPGWSAWRIPVSVEP